jgi:hypothetical protein
VGAVKVGRGEQALDAGDFFVHGVNLCFHAFELALLLE